MKEPVAKLLVCCLLLFFASCSPKKPIPKAPLSFPVKVAAAQQKTVPIFIESLGHVESITAIQIKSRIEGELTGVFFTQGSHVKQGDLLFTIDPKPYEAVLKRAQGSLDQNKANQILAEEKVRRYRILARDDYYSQIDYETLQANLAEANALVQQSQGEVDQASINLNYCWIYAPIGGMMGLLQIDYGNLISADGISPLCSLNQMAPIYVTFSIPEFQLPSIQRAYGKKEIQVAAAYEDFTEESFDGTLAILDNQVNEATGMIKLRAIFDNQTQELWPGQFVRTRLVLDHLENAVIIPHTAVQFTTTAPVVFVVSKEGTVEQRTVKLGQREDDHVIVLEGILPKETVVTEGQMNLFSGARVKVISQ